MSKIVKAGVAAVLLATGLSASAMAAPHRYYHDYDPWFEPLHLDNKSVPAKQFFERAQRDGS